jgi:hypothetical protein
MSASHSEAALRLLLRVSGVALMLALPAALMPSHWMEEIHRRLLGHTLPRSQIVEYLTRSLSLLYAMLGLITWFLASDVRRYAPVIACKSAAGMLFAVGIVALDLIIQMPWYWTATEGPGIFAMCLAGLVLALRVERVSSIPLALGDA